MVHHLIILSRLVQPYGSFHFGWGQVSLIARLEYGIEPVEWKMEWNSDCTQLQLYICVAGAVQSSYLTVEATCCSAAAHRRVEPVWTSLLIQLLVDTLAQPALATRYCKAVTVHFPLTPFLSIFQSSKYRDVYTWLGPGTNIVCTYSYTKTVHFRTD